MVEQDIHKVEGLADSIGRNGVQVPLIIRNDGKLLDGNRRYFACKWLEIRALESKKVPPVFLSEIPVEVILETDLTEVLELKILAEANFIKDLKVAWSLDAQARAVEEFYLNAFTRNRNDRESALTEVVGTFGIKRQRALDLLEALELTKLFINEGDTEDDRMFRRGIVEEKFVYFWEFRNKAMMGRTELRGVELMDVRTAFFKMMAMGSESPIKNVKQIEPIAQARRDKTAWQLLSESNGAKLPLVVSMMLEKREVRKAEDKIRVFIAWLEEIVEFSEAAKGYLRVLAALVGVKAN